MLAKASIQLTMNYLLFFWPFFPPCPAGPFLLHGQKKWTKEKAARLPHCPCASRLWPGAQSTAHPCAGDWGAAPCRALRRTVKAWRCSGAAEREVIRYPTLRLFYYPSIAPSTAAWLRKQARQGRVMDDAR